MIPTPQPGQAGGPARAADGVGALDALRVLRSAGAALLAQAVLHGELARVEWAEEKTRLLKMLAVGLLGFACLLSVLLFGGALLLGAAWHTAYRVPVASLLLALYATGLGLAWWRFRALAALAEHSFAATRDELGVDVALLRKHL